ncbi:glycosyltransferase [uncultured Jannaschia sp.]|uniref:glycosyltransferase n=1 Tax=uncultured Jannaschia sp. TaxID=293347 RepID=UPI00262A9069|nr:glycosyltransferase [uncultured Jannaschia sp.]
MKTAIVHHWLTGMRGGEKVLEQLILCYPDADLFTHVYDPEMVSDLIRGRPVRESFIARLPLGRKYFRHYLWLMPRALEEFDLTGYDLVISSESGPVKGVIAPPDALHVCYCHAPMRYIYDHYRRYRSGLNPVLRAVFSRVAHRLRIWDAVSAMRVDIFVANSHFTARRIRRAYGRGAEVVHPSVDLDLFDFDESAPPAEDAPYLVVSEMVGYKRVDLAIDAFRGLDRKLVIAGDGPDLAKLKRAAPSNVIFRGRVPNAALVELYRTARALVFPGEEDFGIVPVEAMACGCPVLAYDRGGLRESVVDGKTGLMFAEQSATSLRDAIVRFEGGTFSRAAIARHARTFGACRFRREFTAIVDAAMKARHPG